MKRTQRSSSPVYANDQLQNIVRLKWPGYIGALDNIMCHQTSDAGETNIQSASCIFVSAILTTVSGHILGVRLVRYEDSSCHWAARLGQ